MPTATYTGVIQAPPEDVFAFVADAENNPARHAHVVETRWVDEGPTGLGRRGRQSSRLWGRDWAFLAEVAEWEPPSVSRSRWSRGCGSARRSTSSRPTAVPPA